MGSFEDSEGSGRAKRICVEQRGGAGDGAGRTDDGDECWRTLKRDGVCAVLKYISVRVCVYV